MCEDTAMMILVGIPLAALMVFLLYQAFLSGPEILDNILDACEKYRAVINRIRGEDEYDCDNN